MQFKLNETGDCGWRIQLFPYFQKSCIEGDVYQFGVAGGFSLQVLGEMLRGSPQSHSYYGFDVFTGMPVETNEPDKQRDEPGKFDLVKLEGSTNLSDAIISLGGSILSHMRPNTTLKLVQGLVQNTLTDNLAKMQNMRPAFYVDMDMDIYSPTKFALEWLVRNKIVVPGTIIGFDDWGQCPEYPIGTYGESRAWKEVGIKGEKIVETDAAGQVAFIVTEI